MRLSLRKAAQGSVAPPNHTGIRVRPGLFSAVPAGLIAICPDCLLISQQLQSKPGRSRRANSDKFDSQPSLRDSIWRGELSHKLFRAGLRSLAVGLPGLGDWRDLLCLPVVTRALQSGPTQLVFRSLANVIAKLLKHRSALNSRIPLSLPAAYFWFRAQRTR